MERRSKSEVFGKCTRSRTSAVQHGHSNERRCENLVRIDDVRRMDLRSRQETEQSSGVYHELWLEFGVQSGMGIDACKITIPYDTYDAKTIN